MKKEGINKIIVFPGCADGVFFLSEIDYIKQYFDEIIVITYPGDKERFDFLSRDKGFKYFIADTNLRSLFTVNFIKWLFSKYTLKEISKNFSFSIKSFKKISYIFLYGLFYLASKKVIDEELEKSIDDNMYLYSFWLTRGAYTISMFNTNNNSIKKIVSRAHGYDLYENRNILNFLPFRDFINSNLDEIHFISNHGLNYHSSKYEQVNAKRIITRLGSSNGLEVTKRINPTKKIINIASCSSIIDIKRLDLIVDIISNVDLPVRWIHIGEGPLQNSIMGYAKKKLIKSNFQFIGKVDNSEILELYIEYDIDFFINMSDSEGVPVSIMEAISIGIPVIARNVGGIKEIIDVNRGLLINNLADISSVYDEINLEIGKRLNNIELYKKKSENCISYWKEKFNAEQNFCVFFKSIIGD